MNMKLSTFLTYDISSCLKRVCNAWSEITTIPFSIAAPRTLNGRKEDIPGASESGSVPVNLVAGWSPSGRVAIAASSFVQAAWSSSSLTDSERSPSPEKTDWLTSYNIEGWSRFVSRTRSANTIRACTAARREMPTPSSYVIRRRFWEFSEVTFFVPRNRSSKSRRNHYGTWPHRCRHNGKNDLLYWRNIHS